MRLQTRVSACVCVIVLASVSIAVASAAASAAGPRAAGQSITLGVTPRNSDDGGFGTAKPKSFGYGGDPTSFIWDVHWQSWGGSRATATGRADWVWPGWSVASGSVVTAATVVAWDPVSCKGQRVYARVEWYFPSKGQTFSARAGADLCSSTPLPGYPKLANYNCKHGGTVPASGAKVSGVASQIISIDINCANSLKAIRATTPMPHYGHSARYRSGVWWCGAEIPPGSGFKWGQAELFSCQRGNLASFAYQLTPAGTEAQARVASSVISGTPESALETGQLALAPAAASSKPA